MNDLEKLSNWEQLTRNARSPSSHRPERSALVRLESHENYILHPDCPFPVFLNGVRYVSLTVAITIAKLDLNEPSTSRFSQIAATHPSTGSFLEYWRFYSGRSVVRADWLLLRPTVLQSLVTQRFLADSQARGFLLLTQDRPISLLTKRVGDWLYYGVRNEVGCDAYAKQLVKLRSIFRENCEYLRKSSIPPEPYQTKIGTPDSNRLPCGRTRRKHYHWLKRLAILGVIDWPIRNWNS